MSFSTCSSVCSAKLAVVALQAPRLSPMTQARPRRCRCPRHRAAVCARWGTTAPHPLARPRRVAPARSSRPPAPTRRPRACRADQAPCAAPRAPRTRLATAPRGTTAHRAPARRCTGVQWGRTALRVLPPRCRVRLAPLRACSGRRRVTPALLGTTVAVTRLCRPRARPGRSAPSTRC